MSTEPHPAVTFEEIRDQHCQLKSRLAAIEQALDERTASVAEVSDMLGQLGDCLIKHFFLEEEGGYFAEALTHAPQLIERANNLLAQHPKFASLTGEMIDQAKNWQSDVGWWEQTRTRFLQFKAELVRHERQEDGLMQEAYTQDIGAHD
jgi:hypothetical protein